MATLTKEQIKDEFIQFLNDTYGYWTLDNSKDAVAYITGAFDLMNNYVMRLDKAESETDECGK